MPFFKFNYEQIAHIVDKASLSTDNEHEKTRKGILTIVSIIIAVLAVFWGSSYILLGKPYSGAIPLSYSAISFISISYYFHTKHFEFFRFSQLLLIFCLPFLLMWSLGGFANGSVVLVWAFFTPLAALLFADIAHAARWLYAFLIMTIFSAFIDPYLSQTISPMTNTAITIFFALNMGFGFASVFSLLNYFVKEREKAYALTLDAKQELEQSNRQLKSNEKEIKKLLMTDWLTGVANRRQLDGMLQNELEMLHRYDLPLCLIMADIDNFKKINDHYGHSIGDKVIKIFTEVIKEHVRTNDLIARYGGEEFIIMLPNTGQTGAEVLAKRICAAIEAEKISDISHSVTASFGITCATKEDTFDRLLKRVDQAMYLSKKNGRNCCTCL